MHIKYPHSLRRKLRFLSTVALAVIASFGIGIHTAGEVQPISLIEAGSVEQTGDVDGSGILDIGDVIAILEVAQGYREATPEELRTDPNQDGMLTVDDAMRILSTLSLQ